MCQLLAHCVYDSAHHSTCTLSATGSTGRISITVQKDERLLVYDLEAYFGPSPMKRPDRLLIGKVGTGPWVVVLVDLKSGTGWETALEQFRAVLPALGKGGEAGGEEHHRECSAPLPLGKDHRVLAVVVGWVGREYRKSRRRDRKTGDRRQGLRWGSKEVLIASPMSGKSFRSLRDFWIQLGVLPRSG